jgi:hypothetical protein
MAEAERLRRRPAVERNPGNETLTHRHQTLKRQAARALASAALSLSLCGCRPSPPPKIVDGATRAVAGSSPTPASPESPGGPQTEVSVEEFLRHVELLREDRRAGLLRAWRRVEGWKNFRVADASDFKTPGPAGGGASGVLGLPVNSYQVGEIGGNYGDNLAAVVVDETKAGPDRFGVALFVERAGGRYSFYWVQRDRDLSRATLNRHSGNVNLVELREDGTRRSCDIEWTREQGRWACEL